MQKITVSLFKRALAAYEKLDAGPLTASARCSSSIRRRSRSSPLACRTSVL
jgi:hypothetical protein